MASDSFAVAGKEVSKLPAYGRARLGIAIVPQGREIFPLLTVKENLETGFAPAAREFRKVPDEVFVLFPVLQLGACPLVHSLVLCRSPTSAAWPSMPACCPRSAVLARC